MKSTSSILKKIEISTSLKALSTFYGNYLSVHKGYGIDFDQIRPYSIGDDVKKIDWSATARANSVQVRQYYETRSIPVVFIIDCSSSMLFPAYSSESKLDIVMYIVTALSIVAQGHGDNVGAFLGGRKNLLIRPNKKKSQLQNIYFQIQKNYSENKIGINTKTDSILSQYFKLQKKQSICFYISDSNTLDKSDLLAVKNIKKKHDLFYINIPHFEINDDLSDGQVGLDAKTLLKKDIDNTYIPKLNSSIAQLQTELESIGVLFSSVGNSAYIISELIKLLKMAINRRSKLR